MSNELEKLPLLIERATATLAQAKTAGEILEAREQADIAYVAAKAAARLSKLKDAHDTILAACRKTMADALVIEARAQCRLADEYDAAQERGEVQKAGGERGNQFGIIPNENNAANVTDIGLTSKQVFEARKVRDAEKTTPGIIRETVNGKLEAGEEPTRADVKRAVDRPKGDGRLKGVKSRSSGISPVEEEMAVAVLDHGKSLKQAAKDANAGSEQRAKVAVAYERGRRDAVPDITPDMLSMTAQQKLDLAIKQHQQRLMATFHDEVNKRVKEFLLDTFLPMHKKEQKEAKLIMERRKGIMDKSTFRKIWGCLSPESLPRLTGIPRDKLREDVVAIYEDAFRLFSGLEKFLLNEKDSPTKFQTLPDNWEDWEKMKRAATEARKAKRNSSTSVQQV